MIDQINYIYPLHLSTAIILAGLMGTATMLWRIRMRKIGGITGIFFTLFFFFITLYAICQALYPTATTVEIATIISILDIIFGTAIWFFLFLAGEYAASDRPAPHRVAFVSLWYGIVTCGLFLSLFLPPGSGLIYVSFNPEFGWVLRVAPLYIILNTIFGCSALGCFLQFCLKAYNLAPASKFGSHVRQLVVALSIGLAIDIVLITGGWFFEDWMLISPSLTMINTAIFQVIAFLLLFREYRIIYLVPHRAYGLFVLNTTSGTQYFHHEFDKSEVTITHSDLVGGALTAVNSLVQESLNLDKTEWIQEFSTSHRSFLLDMRPEFEIVGVLLISKPTEILRNSLAKLMDSLCLMWEERGLKETTRISDEMEAYFEKILKESFPFVPE
ncbi:MAG TPA: hypothetical protein VKK79_09360 [Candidatus Lokiarchaeia archaeon]|nr:hypothetical protein [Candidatus Lokiarchaeia archaeon]